MAIEKIKENIYYVGAQDFERRIFDELIPLPDGTSYNSYLVKGSEKIALIDTVDPTKRDVLINNLKELNIERLDYIIPNHAEQDHSGCIPDILELYPESRVVTNSKCKTMLMDLLLIPDEKFITVDEKKPISLGGKTLEFIMAPWVHWPETMFTYLREDNILFTCDFLGAHYASDTLWVENGKESSRIYNAAKRYYAEIMMPFRTNVKKNLEKVGELNPSLIAASHGPIYRNKRFIVEAYKDWSSDEVKNEVIVAYVSMHGSTKRIVDYFVESLTRKGISVKLFNLTNVDVGELSMTLVDAATIVIGTPTVLAGAHPSALYATYLVRVLKPKTRFVSIIGSYGWGGRTVEQLGDLLSNLKLEVIEPVIIKGYPREKDFELLDDLADRVVAKHSEIGILI
ncbi:MAG: FprA family A-type flavoprotein [Actinobacteria bacterium]|nr:FprA family A-type flavoprotein [Actinomycetota bacterium]